MQRLRFITLGSILLLGALLAQEARGARIQKTETITNKEKVLEVQAQAKESPEVCCCRVITCDDGATKKSHWQPVLPPVLPGNPGLCCKRFELWDKQPCADKGTCCEDMGNGNTLRELESIGIMELHPLDFEAKKYCPS